MLPLILLVLAAPKASAAPAKPLLPSRAAVFVSSPDEAGAAKVEAELTKALEDASVGLVDVPAGFPLAARDDAGDKLVKDARQAYDDLDYEGAASKWTEALEFFVKNPHLADAKTLADAHFFVGALAIQNGGKSHAKKATEEFVRALLNNPDLTCDPQVYGADVKKAFDKALTEISAKGVGPLAIDSSPPGAMVSLRGKDLGLTPIAEAPSVPVGRHLLTFSKPGFEPSGAYADVSKEGGSAKPTLTAAPGYLEVRDAATAVVGQGVGVKGALPPGAKKLGEVVKARFLVLSDGAIAEVWDVETGNRLAGLSLSAQEVNESAKKIGAFISKPGSAAVAAAEVTDTSEEPSAGGPVYKKWWFWTAVGVVAVGGITAGAVAGANNSGGRPFNVVLGTP
ncbi:MAG: PEGA domain-containing protein [Archangium sp.]|nr:PEGA domain-containing protein [Archangium sp.]MDP3573300.1 PEGA domain-containing protein [Archangium sp.]